MNKNLYGKDETKLKQRNLKKGKKTNKYSIGTQIDDDRKNI